MPSEKQVVDLMTNSGLPPLPAGHPLCDGKEHRFGPKKKAWYKFHKIIDKAGKEAVYGVFGHWSGTDNGAIGVQLDAGEVTHEAMEEARERQEAAAQLEIQKRAAAARNAANRAKSQWAAAGEADPEGTAVSPYLERKGVTRENVRVAPDGLLLVPMKKYSHDGTFLAGLQKIKPDGDKLYNKGMDKIGAACLLGRLSSDTPIIGIAEGYATGRSIRMAHPIPLLVAFDAGNLLPVAQGIRRDFPDARILFFADDDWQLEQRLEKCLREEFKLQEGVMIGAGEHRLTSVDGKETKVTAEWREGKWQRFIEVDIRVGPSIRTRRFENAGIVKALEAASQVGNASIVWPRFADRGDNKWTDFNDLHAHESLDEVERQVLAAISAVSIPSAASKTPMLDDASPSLADDGMDIPAHFIDTPPPGSLDDGITPPIDAPADAPSSAVILPLSSSPSPSPKEKESGVTVAKKSGGDSAGDGGKGGRKPKKRPPEFYETVDFLIENFVLLYGTNTAWDSIKRLQIKITDLRLAYGTDAVKWWLGNGSRRMVDADKLLFDPTMTCDPETTVNLFDGFKVMPKKGKCEKILDLLLHLCDGNEELRSWVLKWASYPLRHPGAKMTTAIIMHGDEGSGKNLFWERIVRRVYGEYAGVIGNAQIESQFNEWASKKLFFVCDEVVTKNELKQLKGKLKQIITGDEIYINPKNLPERKEANFINFVFLSNELQPLVLDKTDRRYLVIWTPMKREKEYYKAVAKEADEGGVEAFYHYLLHDVDLADFDAHTPPLDTRAKKNLIALGMSAPERFYKEWSAQALPLPFICCSAMQLYAAFQRWCHLNGERYPPSQTIFGRTVERIGVGEVSRKLLKYEFGQVSKQRTAYLVGKQPEEKALNEWVEASSELFEGYLRKYRHVYDQSETGNPSHS